MGDIVRAEHCLVTVVGDSAVKGTSVAIVLVFTLGMGQSGLGSSFQSRHMRCCVGRMRLG